MITLDMRLRFKVNGSFGSLANFNISDMLDMKPIEYCDFKCEYTKFTAGFKF